MFDIQLFAYQETDVVTVGQVKTALNRVKDIYQVATDAEFEEMLDEVLPIESDEDTDPEDGEGEGGDGQDGDGGQDG